MSKLEAFFVTIIFMFVGILYTHEITKQSIRKEAIKAGVGHYVIVDKTSEYGEFRWITNYDKTPTNYQ